MNVYDVAEVNMCIYLLVRSILIILLIKIRVALCKKALLFLFFKCIFVSAELATPFVSLIRKMLSSANDASVASESLRQVADIKKGYNSDIFSV